MPGTEGWIVELEGHIFDLLDAETELKTGAVRVAVIDGTYYLRASPLENLTMDQRSLALQRAVDLVRIVNLIMGMLSPVFRGIEAAAVRWLPHEAPQRRFEFTQTTHQLVRTRASRPALEADRDAAP